MSATIKRGDIYIHIDNGSNYWNEQSVGIQRGTRPVVVVSNDAGNKYAPVVTVVPLTTNKYKHSLPTHVYVDRADRGYSLVLCEQVFTCPKSALVNGKKRVTDEEMRDIDRALCVALGLK